MWSHRAIFHRCNRSWWGLHLVSGEGWLTLRQRMAGSDGRAVVRLNPWLLQSICSNIVKQYTDVWLVRCQCCICMVIVASCKGSYYHQSMNADQPVKWSRWLVLYKMHSFYHQPYYLWSSEFVSLNIRRPQRVIQTASRETRIRSASPWIGLYSQARGSLPVNIWHLSLDHKCSGFYFLWYILNAIARQWKL